MPSIDEAAKAFVETEGCSPFWTGRAVPWESLTPSQQEEVRRVMRAPLLALSRSKIDDSVIEAAIDAYHRADRKGADDAVVIRAALTAALAKLAEKEGVEEHEPTTF